MNHVEARNDSFTSTGLRQGSLGTRILVYLRKHHEESYTHKALATALKAKESSVRTACSRLVAKNRIVKCKMEGFCFYYYPGGTMDQIERIVNLCDGLPYKRIHNLCLYHEMKVNQRTILGVEHTLGARKGSKIWYDRRLSWEIGRNSRKKKGPSITLRLKCSEKPLNFDKWLSFLDYLEGMLGLKIKENHSEWKLLAADFNHDRLIGPDERWTGSLTIKAFTNVLARIYCKEINGQWFEREEFAYSAKAEHAISLEDWRGRIMGSVRPYTAENMIVASLNHQERNSRAMQQSMRRMEKSQQEMAKEFQEGLSTLSNAIKGLAEAVKDLNDRKKKEGSP